jgi:hypothetical protein
LTVRLVIYAAAWASANLLAALVIILAAALRDPVPAKERADLRRDLRWK